MGNRTKELAVDQRGRVRLWDNRWNVLADERAQPGERLGDIVQRMLTQVGRNEANLTVDDNGTRESGYAYLTPELKIIDHREIRELTQWPDY